MTEEEKKLITREKHPGRVDQDHKFAALMKKGKEEILRNKEQPTEESTEESTEQSTEKPLVKSKVQSNDTYVYGVGMHAVLASGVCLFFAYNTSQSKTLLLNEKKRPTTKTTSYALKKYTING